MWSGFGFGGGAAAGPGVATGVAARAQAAGGVQQRGGGGGGGACRYAPQARGRDRQQCARELDGARWRSLARQTPEARSSTPARRVSLDDPTMRRPPARSTTRVRSGWHAPSRPTGELCTPSRRAARGALPRVVSRRASDRQAGGERVARATCRAIRRGAKVAKDMQAASPRRGAFADEANSKRRRGPLPPRRRRAVAVGRRRRRGEEGVAPSAHRRSGRATQTRPRRQPAAAVARPTGRPHEKGLDAEQGGGSSSSGQAGCTGPAARLFLVISSTRRPTSARPTPSRGRGLASWSSASCASRVGQINRCVSEAPACKLLGGGGGDGGEGARREASSAITLKAQSLAEQMLTAATTSITPRARGAARPALPDL